ncbi:hypothetical protein PCANC_01568 [Puccinia coronata f. sp. avenae]|uniref:Uncharacterized protein n=2 Tax=Puccinia coronata f. sp. avenae TaxID=200324 RepID=A0A2N5W0E9_9BASI|nr:hypothetical protein PCANC_01568 [Puccinia coronata f. sp. avenae]
MPRLHSVSHYHSQPSIKQSPGAKMSPLPLLHLNPRNSPLKSRPATPVHSQNTACQSIKPRRAAPNASNRIKPKSAPRSTSTNSTCPKRLSKSRNDTPLAAPIQPTPAAPQPPNSKVTSKRSRKPREATTSPPPAPDQPVSHLYNLSCPEPNQLFIASPDRLTNNPSPTPRTSDSTTKRQVLSLTDFCDQLTAEVHDQSFGDSLPRCPRPSKKKSGNRKTKKGGQRRAPMCPPLSDSEEVLTLDHSIFHPHACPSRSGTPSPIQVGESPSMLSGPALVLGDGELSAAPPATIPSTLSRLSSARPTDSASSSPTRQHVRAKSVASIFDLEKPRLASKPRGAKDDWDMPPGAPPRGLTWQQKEKKDKTPLPASASGNLAQKLAHHDSTSTPTFTVTPHAKETPARRHRTALARTSSATALPQPAGSTAKTISSSSRSDDESAMTWQQSIIRPSLRHTTLTSRSDQLANTSENKLSNKKNSAPPCSKTPVKATGIPRKAGVTSLLKPRTSAPLPTSHKRRNSLSSPRVSTCKPLENIPINEKTRSLGLKSGENVFSEWKSFTTSSADGKSAEPIFSNPLPILGTQADFNTPNRRHVQSYTHQPAVLSHSFMQSLSQPNHSAPASYIPDSHHAQAMTPSKPRSTSEDLHLSTPVNKLSTPALRAAFIIGPPFFSLSQSDN